MNEVEVALNVEQGMVGVVMRETGSGRFAQGSFEPKNAYQLSIALGRAAMEAHAGKKVNGDTEFLAGELRELRVKVSDQMRDYMIAKVSSVIKTGLEHKRSPGQIAMGCVDEVLKDTAR